MWSRTSGRSRSSIFGDRGSAFKGELATWQGVLLGILSMGVKRTLTSNLSTVDEPVTVLPTALVSANSGGVDHCDRIGSIEGDGRVDRSQRELGSGRNFCRIIQSRA